MPQAWKDHWGFDVLGDEIAGLKRDQLVHTLGNLTLVNAKLNPTLSNRPWTSAEAQARNLGPGGKRDYLLSHSQLKLNAQLVTDHVTTWTEGDIRARTDAMIQRICQIWPCPPYAAQPHGSGTATGEDLNLRLIDESIPPGKYTQLRDWLAIQQTDEVRLTFEQIESIINSELPESARRYSIHWRSYAGSSLTRSIQDAGWRTQSVDFDDRRVVLERQPEDADKEIVQEAPLKAD